MMGLFSHADTRITDKPHEPHKPKECNRAFGKRIRELVDAGYEVRIVGASSDKESGEITLSIR